MNRIVSIIATTALIIAGMGIVGGLETADATQAPSPTLTTPAQVMFHSIFTDASVPPCVYEDGSEMLDMALADDPNLVDITTRYCKWDAGDRGNGYGDSFIVIAAPVAGGGVQLFYVYESGLIEL
jgi:hypothetical protein